MPFELIENRARWLASQNREADPSITDVYWFPDDKEVRLVEVTQEVSMTDDRKVRPFYFRPTADLPVPSGIALIRPEQFGRLELPKEWGDWDRAVQLRDDR